MHETCVIYNFWESVQNVFFNAFIKTVHYAHILINIKHAYAQLL